MRLIKSHIVDGEQTHQLEIHVHDEPGAGGANHAYVVYGFNTAGNRSAGPSPFSVDETRMPVLFQNGPIKEDGVNGVTHEALLAILIDRFECFQEGPYKCLENASALYHLRAALSVMQERTRARMARGVEGTHEK